MENVLEILLQSTRVDPSSGRRRAAGRAETKPNAAESTSFPAVPSHDSEIPPEIRRPTSKRRAAILLAASSVIWLVAVRAQHGYAVAAGPLTSASEATVGGGEFDLFIESTPSGATVQENGQTLGSTPLHISVGNASVRAEVRTFSVQLAGYRDYVLSQGPSDRAVAVRAALEPLPAGSPSASSPAPAPPRTIPGQGGTNHPCPRPPPPKVLPRRLHRS
jgi:hypothetical protein